MSGRPLMLMLWAITCALAGLIVFHATVLGIGLSADSAVYIAATRQWLHPLGLTPLLASGEGIVATSVVPAYIFVLTLTSVALQTDPIHAARWLHVMLLPLNLVLAGLLVHRARPSSRWSPWIAAVMLLVSRGVLSIHARAWTEPLFLTFALVALYGLDRWMTERSSSAWPAIAVAAIAAACLTRFAGVALAGTAMIAIAFRARGSLVRRGLLSIAVGVSVVFPMLMWSAFTPGFRSVVYHPPPLEWWGEGLETVSTWIAPQGVTERDGVRLGMGIAVLLGVGWLTAIARRHAETRNGAR